MRIVGIVTLIGEFLDGLGGHIQLLKIHSLSLNEEVKCFSFGWILFVIHLQPLIL